MSQAGSKAISCMAKHFSIVPAIDYAAVYLICGKNKEKQGQNKNHSKEFISGD
jgi:hypothetical protein